MSAASAKFVSGAVWRGGSLLVAAAIVALWQQIATQWKSP